MKLMARETKFTPSRHAVCAMARVNNVKCYEVPVYTNPIDTSDIDRTCRTTVLEKPIHTELRSQNYIYISIYIYIYIHIYGYTSVAILAQVRITIRDTLV